MGSGAAGQPMNSDNTSWPFTSPAGKDATRPHEIDLYIEPSPRDSPTALPKLFTTLGPEPLAPAHVQPKGFVFPPAAPDDADLDAADLDADADLDDDADLDGGSEKNAASDFCAEAFSDAETEGHAIR